MLIHLLTTTPNGAMWADARACGIAADAGVAMQRNRHQAPVTGGSYGTRVSNGTTKQWPEGLGGSTG